ncbi:MAG: hypothetical protein LBV09_05045, partial [Deferribacteraceae bacterium]|nr:hypothetical protein [Deferribacteraceae bacterium]
MSNKEDLDLLDFDSTETKPVEVEKEQIKESDSGLKRAVYMGVSVFGAGFFPFASGTFGSLVTIPLAWLFIIIGGARGLAISSVVFFILGYIMVAIALQYSES